MASIVPHVTEEIFQSMYAEGKHFKSVHRSPWPTTNRKLIDEEVEKCGDIIMTIIIEIRREKAERRLPLNTKIKKLTIYAGEKTNAKMITEGQKDIAGTCKVENIQILPTKGEGREIKPYSINFVAEI